MSHLSPSARPSLGRPGSRLQERHSTQISALSDPHYLDDRSILSLTTSQPSLGSANCPNNLMLAERSSQSTWRLCLGLSVSSPLPNQLEVKVETSCAPTPCSHQPLCTMNYILSGDGLASCHRAASSHSSVHHLERHMKCLLVTASSNKLDHDSVIYAAET